MSYSKFGEFGKQGKKKAKSENLEDGPSSFRSSPSPQWHETENIPDGGIEDFGIDAWKQKGVCVEEEELDPLMVFGSGIMMMILSKLDARSVALARLVSRDWLIVASSDKIWAPKGEELSHCSLDFSLFVRHLLLAEIANSNFGPVTRALSDVQKW